MRGDIKIERLTKADLNGQISQVSDRHLSEADKGRDKAQTFCATLIARDISSQAVSKQFSVPRFPWYDASSEIAITVSSSVEVEIFRRSKAFNPNSQNACAWGLDGGRLGSMRDPAANTKYNTAVL